MMLIERRFLRVLRRLTCLLLLLSATQVRADEPWIVFPAGEGIGAGKHIVLISGDEEYRSEEALPMLAGILSQRCGFRCTVLFAISRTTGEIDPNTVDNIPGLEHLESADLMIVFTRFRDLPDGQMRHIDAYLQTGKPVVGIRPAVVAFRNKPDSSYAKYSSDYRGEDFHQGFGRQVLGATWISHHGQHGRESTRGIPVEAMKGHPILRGVGTMWGPTDLYTVRTPIPQGGQVLVMGQVLEGMQPDAAPAAKSQMPLAWIKHFPTPRGNARVFMTTMGDAQDFQDESFRRMVVNACLWAVGSEAAIPDRTEVDTIGPYDPSPFGFNAFRKGRFPRDGADLGTAAARPKLVLHRGDHICYIGNTLADRMQHFGWLETLLQSHFPEHELVFRNLGFAADELTVRPRSMNFGDPHAHLEHSKADIVFAFFGYNESFGDEAGLDSFRADLRQFITDTRSHTYNGRTPPQLVLCSPIAHENLHDPDLPDGRENNRRLKRYTQAMEEVARQENVVFIDLFTPTSQPGRRPKRPWTINGIHLNEEGHRQVAETIVRDLFGEGKPSAEAHLERVRAAVLDKNLRWFNRYRATDGYSTYGQRAYLTFVDGQSNKDVMDREMQILDVLVANRDKRIWAAARGRDLTVDDRNAPAPLPVKTNVGGGSSSSSALKEGSLNYLGGEEAIGRMTVAKGMRVGLFASEEQFPELVNPVQMSVDTDGRLWVAAWHTYPHWDPNKELNDQLLILPDENGDGKADRCIVFADHLHNPTGFEFWNGGVLVAAAPDILFLKDTDGDDRADVRMHLLHGIDSADTHCNANSFVLGPDGCIYFSEGIFHYTNIETPWGKPLRTKAPMLYRWNPRTGQIAEHFYLSPNPHGIAIDQWGCVFATDATTGQGFYVGYPGKGTPHPLYPQRVRPVAGLGLLGGTHFPEGNRGNLLICNTIGFLGILQHEFIVDGADIRSQEIEPIVVSSDGNFRPVDVEIGADGALYFLDWHNAIIGHMQHNLRDPSRDHAHGRVYRVTAADRPLLKPVRITGKPIDAVLALLESPEDAVRYRARIELSGRETGELLAAANRWAAGFEPANRAHAHHLLEALWLYEQRNVVNEPLLEKVLDAPHHRARAAAVRVLGHWAGRVHHGLPWLLRAAHDTEPMVRAEAVVAAASFEGLAAAEVVFAAQSYPTDDQLAYAIRETRQVTDRFWQEALRQGKPLSPAGQSFVLQHGDGPDLLLLPPSEAACRAILGHAAVSQEQRGQALRDLSARLNQPAAEILLSLVEHREDTESKVHAELVALFSLLPREQLVELKPRLAEMIRTGKHAGARSAAVAALLQAGEPVDAVFATATVDWDGAMAFLNSIALIADAAQRSALYGHVRSLILHPPQHLGTPPAGTTPAAGPLDGGDLAAAALRAIRHIPDRQAEVFVDMVALIQGRHRHRGIAIDVLKGIQRQHWQADQLPALAASVVELIGEMAPPQRTSPAAAAAFELATELVAALPPAAATPLREKLDALRVHVIELGTVPHRMIYDKDRLIAQAGSFVELRFSNSDQMPHNLAIVEPGVLEEVGLLAETTGTAPEAAAKHYIPQSASVLLGSRLLQSGERQTMFFHIPSAAGIYPYVCTYPGHWRRMYGALYIVDDLAAYDADPAAYLAQAGLQVRDPLLKYVGRDTEWTLEDLAPGVRSLMHERSFDVGQMAFQVANCIACHRVGDTGREYGPDLAQLDSDKLTPEQILRAILEPSAEINEKFQTHTFLLGSGKVVTGMIVEEAASSVSVIADPLVTPEPIVLSKAEIEEQHTSAVSLMPQGLLSKLTREEILDLIAYVAAKGDKEHPLFHAGHQH